MSFLAGAIVLGVGALIGWRLHARRHHCTPDGGGQDDPATVAALEKAVNTAKGIDPDPNFPKKEQ